MNFTAIAALAILVITYAGVALGRIPGLRLDRAGIALLGAAGMIAIGALSLDDAYKVIDWNTLTLLIGMMIVVAHLKVSGAFRAVGGLAVRYAQAPLALLAAVVLVSGVLSAFLVNDAICLAMAPIVVEIARALKRNPAPYLVAAAAASNCGSVGTITGNPQNMVIGAMSGVSYPAFSAALAPVALVSLVLVVVVVRLVYRAEFRRPSAQVDSAPFRGRIHIGQMLKAMFVCVALGVAFFAGMAPARAALYGGAFLLLTRAIKPHRIYREIDGPLLILFAGLFVVVAGAERVLLTPQAVSAVASAGLSQVWRLSAVTAFASNIVSNVPAVLALRPFVAALHDPGKAWLVVAMSSTLAGNFTLLGSVANLIVAEQGARAGAPISFGAYFRVGAPLTLLTLAAGTAWLAWT